MRRRTWSLWNRYHVWKPLGLYIVAALTSPDWQVQVLDENVENPDYSRLPKPDLVGIGAFTSQATRAYEIAAGFRARGVPVVLGGIHASMCPEEAQLHADAIVMGEAETVWPQVLDDARNGSIQRLYRGTPADLEKAPSPRHDILPNAYRFASVQTSRGCPLNCRFCSVTSFNGGRYRRRPLEAILEDLRKACGRYIFLVDDNLIGTRPEHIAEAKRLFRAMIREGLVKPWIGQTTLNFGDDEELLNLAEKAGCLGVLIGFEALSALGLREIGKSFHARSPKEVGACVRRIQERGILVAGSFILGLDVHRRGIGREIAVAADGAGMDILDGTFLTPLPGTRLWDEMREESRLVLNNFPADWAFYTLSLPVARYRHLSWAELLQEMQDCYATFYSYDRLVRRVACRGRGNRRPLTLLGVSLSCRRGALSFDRQIYGRLDLSRGYALDCGRAGPETRGNG